MDNFLTYFNGEKLQCINGAIFSIICISASSYFLFLQKPFFKGMAYTFLPFAIILLAVCVGVIVRVPKDIERISFFYEQTPEKLQTEELPRMKKVLKSFSILKKAEIGLILIGLGLSISFWRNDLIRGIAIGLLLMGIALYIFDHIAELRAERYVQFLESL